MSMTITPITQHHVAGLLSPRPLDSHKGMFGTVTVIGGASGMVGAALLAARAALKLGAGCVHVVLLADNAPTVDLVQPELMLHTFNRGDESRHLNDTSLPNIFKSDVLVIGCGMACNAVSRQILHDALLSQAVLVLDADALNLLAEHDDLRHLLSKRETATVLTPHPGEAARLLACSTAQIQADRIAAVTRLARMFDCAVVLKGASSLCVTGDGRLFSNTSGNPGMSSPGMGDVLSGMIAALIAQGLSADEALLLAVYLHGAAGDELAAQGITIGMTASELSGQARQLLNQWTNI